MKTVVLARKIYGYPNLVNKEEVVRVVEKVLIQKISEVIDCPALAISLDSQNRVIVKFESRDEALIENILIKEFGKIIDLDGIKKGSIVKGTLKLVGKIKYGFFVDVGIEERDGTIVDVLIRRNVVEAQLFNGRPTMIKKMVFTYGFLMDYIPVEIEITDYDKYNRKVEGKFSEGFLMKVREWMNQNQHLIFVTGVPRQAIKKTLAKAGFSLNVERIDRLGFLENLVKLFPKTNAPGVIAKIGKYIDSAKFGLFIPENIREVLSRPKTGEDPDAEATDD